MEFIIVVAGIIILAVVIYRNSKRKNGVKDVQQDRGLKRNEFMNKVTDRDLQWEIEDFYKEHTCDHEMYERLRPILSQIKGFEHIMVDYDSFLEYNLDIPRGVKQRALMAVEGKISGNDVWGIDTPMYHEDTDTHRGYMEKWKRNNEFMIWMDKELQKHGVEPMLYVDYTTTPWKVPDVTDYGVPPHSDAEVNNGHYYWPSMGARNLSIKI